MNRPPDSQLIFLELNEVNFDYLRAYADKGLLPTFARLLDKHGYALTESEREYQNLEPWIQWVTAHTGKTFAEHGVFRLGDIVNHEIPQIWEKLEQSGLRVGAISPMNAKNRLSDAAFFVPDPWTQTKIDASPTLKLLYAAIAQAVSDNAAARLSAHSLLDLLRGFLIYSAPENWPTYLRMALSARGQPWRKAMVLDLLLADVFLRETSRTKPHFATLFLNAAAHIQHHYLFCASAYQGTIRNPEWYVKPGKDPVFEVYSLYDRILASVQRKFPNARLMIGTGLHQNPHPTVTFYWRLIDHTDFMRRLGIEFESVAPRMSRDFLVSCGSAEKALRAEKILREAHADDGAPLFEVDNRGEDLFVMFTYPNDIAEKAGFGVGDRRLEGLRSQVAFVALKNGEHDGLGYLTDTGVRLDPKAPPISLASIPALVFDYLLKGENPFGVPPYRMA
jgi:Type I phosphodiesterase / nucleotide pyrophosphatase